jgi:hypothetical protein
MEHMPAAGTADLRPLVRDPGLIERKLGQTGRTRNDHGETPLSSTYAIIMMKGTGKIKNKIAKNLIPRLQVKQ